MDDQFLRRPGRGEPKELLQPRNIEGKAPPAASAGAHLDDEPADTFAPPDLGEYAITQIRTHIGQKLLGTSSRTW